MRATIQVNENGSWRNVVTFDPVTPERSREVRAALGYLGRVLGPRVKWRVKREGELVVLLDDAQIRREEGL